VNSDLWAPVGTFAGKNGHRIIFNPDYLEMPDVQKWQVGWRFPTEAFSTTKIATTAP